MKEVQKYVSEVFDLEKELFRLNEKADRAAVEYSQVVLPTYAYKDMTKAYLAAKIEEYRKKDTEASEARLENLARADEAYQVQLKDLARDLRESKAKEIIMERFNNKIESVRTAISLRKSEINRLGG